MSLTAQLITSTKGLELLNKIFLGAGEAILIVGSNGEIKLVNRRAEEIFGYEQNELINKPIEDLIPKKYGHEHVKKREAYIKNPVTRPMGIGKNLTGLRKNGDEFPVEVSLGHVEHLEDKLVVAFVSDITLRKQQEDSLRKNQIQLKEYAEQLEAKVNARTQELEHSNLGLKSQIRERKLAEQALQESLAELTKAEQELQKALINEKELNEMKSRFISMASHEFRTPLTTIESSADLIARYEESHQQEKRLKHISRIKTSVQNLTNILNDFLSLEKLESGVINLNLEKIKLKDMFEEVEDMFEFTLKGSQQLQISSIPDVEVYTDPHILKNIIINLLSNAIKYSHDDGLIEITTSHSNDLLTVVVKDYGIGISEADQKNLFQRFFRAENATNIQGTGLGLNIVKRYLELLKGYLFIACEWVQKM
jgi:PAS domain S-box-containing protein